MNQATNAILMFVLNKVVKLDFIQGHRMYLGGASAILGGVVLGLDMLISGDSSAEKVGAVWAAISLGLTTIGAAGKLDAANKVQP